MPYVRDYVGFGYGRRKGTAMSTKGSIGFRCTSCNALRYVTKTQLTRRAKPRCLKCGGCVIESNEHQEKTKQHRQPLARAAGVRCKACGILFPILREIEKHFSHSVDCERYYITEKLPYPGQEAPLALPASPEP